MPDNEMVYKEPAQFQELPAEVVRKLDGNHLKVRSGEAIQLLTVSEDGWPHAARLSVGEFLLHSLHGFIKPTTPLLNSKNAEDFGRRY